MGVAVLSGSLFTVYIYTQYLGPTAICYITLALNFALIIAAVFWMIISWVVRVIIALQPHSIVASCK